MVSLHFRNADAVEFQVEQTVTGLRAGNYRLSIQAQGGDLGADAELYLYAIADGQSYTVNFEVSGWLLRTQPVPDIPCESGEIIVGCYVKGAGGGWGTLDDFLLDPIEE